MSCNFFNFVKDVKNYVFMYICIAVFKLKKTKRALLQFKRNLGTSPSRVSLNINFRPVPKRPCNLVMKGLYCITGLFIALS